MFHFEEKSNVNVLPRPPKLTTPQIHEMRALYFFTHQDSIYSTNLDKTKEADIWSLGMDVHQKTTIYFWKTSITESTLQLGLLRQERSKVQEQLKKKS